MVALKLDLTVPAPEPEHLASTLTTLSQNCTLLIFPEDVVLATVSVRLYLKAEDKIVTIPLPASLCQYMFKVLFQTPQKSRKTSTSFSSMCCVLYSLLSQIRGGMRGANFSANLKLL